MDKKNKPLLQVMSVVFIMELSLFLSLGYCGFMGNVGIYITIPICLVLYQILLFLGNKNIEQDMLEIKVLLQKIISLQQDEKCRELKLQKDNLEREVQKVKHDEI